MRAHGIVHDYEEAATKPRSSCSCPDLEHACASRLCFVVKLFLFEKKLVIRVAFQFVYMSFNHF